MELIKITDLTKQLGMSSRTLRYYEQVGLIESSRPPFEAYRYYTEESVQRLKQIMILRKMQIPVKDIIRIYENPEMSTLVAVFAERIGEIDKEVTALSELKNIINTFLQKMVTSGIKKISALPLLYEEMEKQFELIEEKKRTTYHELSEIGRTLQRPVESSIVRLPAMRVLSSYLKSNPDISDAAGFFRYVQANGIPYGEPGCRRQFEYQDGELDVVVLRVDDGYENNGEYADFMFDGGLFAAANVYVDEDLREYCLSLVKSFDDNKFYEIDYGSGEGLRHPVLLENLISPDEKRELVCLYVPVKKRAADPALYGRAAEIPSDSITVREIEEENPVLWEVLVPMDGLTPINHPHYRVTENGEAEYTGWISSRVLGTKVAVKLPYRVDIEFRIPGNDERFGYGDNEGSIVFYHGNVKDYYSRGRDYQFGFGINMGNQASDSASESVMRRESIVFHQPFFFDLYDFPGRGKIRYGEYNHVTWIVGERHLAVIINGEIRYCGTGFPYMSLDLSGEKEREIVVGSNGQGMKYFRSIRISQLAHLPKTKLKKEELLVLTRKSNHVIPTVHRLVTDEYGENYWFNGCAKYVMECLGETDYDYDFFSGLTGDVFAQYYPHGEFRGEGVSGYMLCENRGIYLKETQDRFELCEGDAGFVERLFLQCGYASTFVPINELKKNTRMYLETMVSYLDRGVPVILWGFGGKTVYVCTFGVIVGYEEYGKTILYITGNSGRPERISESDLLAGGIASAGWIFVGDKIKNVALADIYRERIRTLPKLLVTDTEKFCFGAGAFRLWADEIENGKFDGMKPEEFDPWVEYTSYVCGLATNASCSFKFLEDAMKLNPDLGFLGQVRELYSRCAMMWNNEDGKDLEAIGGGFNITLGTLKDETKRKPIAAKLREFADVNDEIVRVLNQGIAGVKQGGTFSG